MAANPTDDESRVLRRFYSQIEAVLDPVEVAKLLWQDGLLTDAQLDNIEQSSTPLEQRRTDIMSAARRVVRGDPKKLWVLITALEKFPASVPVANKMRQALNTEDSAVPTSSRGVWQITHKQAELVLSSKPNGSFLVREIIGEPVYDPSSSSICTHVICVVVNGRVHHLAIYKKGNYYGLLTEERFLSIESMIALYSARAEIRTEDKILVKLANQLIPDKDTSPPPDPPPIIQRYTFNDVASLPKHYPHHDKSTWFCPLLSKEESAKLLTGRVDKTFLVRATELSGPNHVYTVDVVVQRNLTVSLCVYKDDDWLQLDVIGDFRHDSINTLVMHHAIGPIPINMGDHVVLAYLRYPVHSSQ